MIRIILAYIMGAAVTATTYLAYMSGGYTVVLLSGLLIATSLGWLWITGSSIKDDINRTFWSTGSRKAPFFYAYRNQFPDPHRASCRTELPRPVPRSAPSLKPSAASRQKFVRPYKKPKPVPRSAPSLTLRISSFLYVRTNLECTHVSHWFIYNVYFFGLLSTYCIFFFKQKWTFVSW